VERIVPQSAFEYVVVAVAREVIVVIGATQVFDRDEGVAKGSAGVVRGLERSTVMPVDPETAAAWE